MARNPKDVIVSYYHYHRVMNFHSYQGDLDAFADYFLKDQVWCAPYFPHLLQAWKKRHHPNMLFLFYEDLKRVKDTPGYKSWLETIVEFHGRRYCVGHGSIFRTCTSLRTEKKPLTTLRR